MSVNFANFGSVQTAPYVAAFNQAKTIVGKAHKSAEMIQANPKYVSQAYTNAKAAFARFWGGNNPGQVAVLLGHLKGAFFNSAKVLTIHYDPNDPDKAYIFKADKASSAGAGDYTPDIYFTPVLIRGYTALGTNSAAGSIIHELSHLVLATVDHVYGMKSCTELSDAEKITNADNFKYYCELFQLINLNNLPALSDDYDKATRPPR